MVMTVTANRSSGGGWTLALAHVGSGDRIALAACLGESGKFEEAIAGCAETCANQTERDYAAFQAP
jgi:hypothetical protein